MTYSFQTGMQKSAKNVAIIWIPAIIAGLLTMQTQVPDQYAIWIGLVASFLAYLLKNYIENKD